MLQYFKSIYFFQSSRNASPFGILTDSNVVKALRTSDVVGGRAFNTVAPSIKGKSLHRFNNNAYFSKHFFFPSRSNHRIT